MDGAVFPTWRGVFGARLAFENCTIGHRVGVRPPDLSFEEPRKSRRSLQNALLLVIHVQNVERLRGLGQVVGPGSQQAAEDRSGKRIEEKCHARTRRQGEFDCIAAKHSHGYDVRDRRCARRPYSFGRCARAWDGVQSRRRRERDRSAARSMARPMPAPRSTNVYCDRLARAAGIAASARGCLEIPKERSRSRPLRGDRCGGPHPRWRPATRPLVRTPNSRSNGWRIRPSLTGSPARDAACEFLFRLLAWRTNAHA